jgi:hypothetical protein
MLFSLFLLVSINIIATIYGKYCFEKAADVSDTVLGHFSPGNDNENTNSAYFSRKASFDDWAATACPVELISTSCYLDIFGRNKTLAVLAERLHFVSSHCFLRNYSYKDFFQLLSNRKILIGGDGISKQFWTYIICSLHNTTFAKYDIKWVSAADISTSEASGCPLGPKHCRFSSATVYYPEHNLKFYYENHIYNSKMSFRKIDIVNIYKSIGFSRNDVVVFNFGHNFHEDEFTLYKRFLKKFADDYEFSSVTKREVCFSSNSC